MRRLPAIDQLNSPRDGPIPIADQMRRMLRPLLPGLVNHFGPRNQKTPTLAPQQRGSPSVRFARCGFASTNRPFPAFRPGRQMRRHQRCLPQPFANRTLDAAHPVPGAAKLMAMSRFFGKPLVAHFIAQQRHAAGHATTLAAAEHGDLPADFAVAGGNGASVAMVAMHGWAAMGAGGLVVVQGLLQSCLQLGGFGVPVGFPCGPTAP